MKDWEPLGYELTLKEIDHMARYEPLELCGLSGLGIDKMKYLLESRMLSTDAEKRVLGADFLHWVEQHDLPVAKQS